MLKEAAEAAWRVFESSGLRMLDGGGVSTTGGTFTVKCFTEIPVANPISKVTTNKRAALSLIIGGKIYSQIMTEPDGGIVFGVQEDPSTVAGAIGAATRLVEFLTKPR